MPAPDASLLAALRDERIGVARHLFYRMTHSQGTVLAWDGIGEYTLDGETYLGIGSLASIEGISQSRELQNHMVEVTLQGVSVPSLRDTDQNVRGQTAAIKALWIDSEGTAHGPLTLFDGLADNMSIALDAGSVALKVRLRAPLANWARPPAAYYTPNDQARTFPGDTGLNFVPDMELAQASGWSVAEETSGARPVAYLDLSAELLGIFDDLNLVPIGDHTLGPGPNRGAVAGQILAFKSGDEYVENVTFAAATAASNDVIKVGGTGCYIDINGDLRTPGGERLVVSGSAATRYLRKQGDIAAIGAATADTVVTGTIDKAGGFSNFVYGLTRLFVDGDYVSDDQEDLAGMVYCNKYHTRGGAVDSNEPFRGTSGTSDASAPRYKEAGTGNAVAMSGGTLKCNGADCTISSTGAVRTNTGNFVVLNGGSVDEDLDAFLRVWT